MKFFRLIIFATILFFNAYGECVAQINNQESSVEVVGYWNRNEKLTYILKNLKYKITEEDTTTKEYYNYSIEISVKDSASKSYQFDWVYSNYQSNIENKLLNRLKGINQGLKVKVITTEIGSYVGVSNFEEIKQKLKPLFTALKTEFKDVANSSTLIRDYEVLYSSKESIENLAFKEIQQYYSFYGEKYKLDTEVKGKAKVRNNFGGDPFDASLSIKLTEIDKEDNNSVIKLNHNIDSKQAKEAISDANLIIGNDKSKKYVAINNTSPINYFEKITSRIHAPTGWVLYSNKSLEIVSGKSKNVEEAIFKIK